MTKLVGSLALTAMAFALTSRAALAQPGIPFQASFTAAFVGVPNTNQIGFCGGPTGTAAYPYVVEAHGVGISTLGFLSMTLKKTLPVTGPMHGCLTLTAANGDTMSAIYDGTEGDILFLGVEQSYGFQFGTGTLTFTGGTGQFRGATGTVKFTASFSQIEMASYLFEGSVLFGRGN